MHDSVDRPELAYLYATLCFFGGVAVTALFDLALHYIPRLFSRRSNTASVKSAPGGAGDNVESKSPKGAAALGSSDESSGETNPTTKPNVDIEQPGQVTHHHQEVDMVGHGGEMIASIYSAENRQNETSKLIRMGIFAGIALAFHVSHSASPPLL